MLKILNNSQVIIEQELYKDMCKYINKPFEYIEEYDQNNFLVELELFQNYYSRLNDYIDKKYNILKKIVEKNSNIDFSFIENKYNDYIEQRFTLIRQKFHFEKNDDKYDIPLEKAIEICGVIDDYIAAPILIEQIGNKIDKLESLDKNNVSVSSIKNAYNNLCRNKSKLIDFEKLEERINILFKDTYINNLNDLSKIQNSNTFSYIFVDMSHQDLMNIYDESIIKGSVINEKNLDKFSYGFIVDPTSIIRVKDINGNYPLFSEINYEYNSVDLNKLHPIAIYAISDGSKTMNPNYNNALKLAEKHMEKLPFYDIDSTKYTSKDNLEEIKNSLIKNLLDDKGITLSKTDNYNQFNYFFEEYMKLKSSNYDETSIRNLFDFCFNLIYSSTYKDVSRLFSGLYDYKEIKEVLEQNIYHRENIFRYKIVNSKMLINFAYKYKHVINNSDLQRIYPGIDIIISKILTSTSDELINLAYDINSTGVVDSWLISNNIKNVKKVNIKQEDKTQITFKEYVQNHEERDKKAETLSSAKKEICKIKEFLKQNDVKENNREDNSLNISNESNISQIIHRAA